MGNFCYQSQSDKLRWIRSNSERSETINEFWNVKHVHKSRDYVASLLDTLLIISIANCFQLLSTAFEIWMASLEKNGSSERQKTQFPVETQSQPAQLSQTGSAWFWRLLPAGKWLRIAETAWQPIQTSWQVIFSQSQEQLSSLICHFSLNILFPSNCWELLRDKAQSNTTLNF